MSHLDRIKILPGKLFEARRQAGEGVASSSLCKVNWTEKRNELQKKGEETIRSNTAIKVKGKPLKNSTTSQIPIKLVAQPFLIKL